MLICPYQCNLHLLRAGLAVSEGIINNLISHNYKNSAISFPFMFSKRNPDHPNRRRQVPAGIS